MKTHIYEESLNYLKNPTLELAQTSSLYLGSLFDLLVRNIVGIELLESWHVVQNVCGIVTQEAHWVRS